MKLQRCAGQSEGHDRPALRVPDVRRVRPLLRSVAWRKLIRAHDPGLPQVSPPPGMRWARRSVLA